jgi:hypothetical protein
MTVGELMDILSKADKDTLVLVNGYENGYDEIHSVDTVDVFKKKVYASWEGSYGDLRYDHEDNNKGEQTAILISRGGVYG